MTPKAWMILYPLGLIFLFGLTTNAVKTDDTEYCHLETMNASCPSDQVLLMQHARYGRMKVGRCLLTNYYVGCSANVIGFLDTRCSGNRRCSVNVLDPELVKFQPCRVDLMAYLQATYVCVKGNPTNTVSCQSRIGSSITGARLSPDVGYLHPLGTDRVRLGTSDCPWAITVLAGQRINVTLYNFNLYKQRDRTTNGNKENKIDSTFKQCHLRLRVEEGSDVKDIQLCNSDAQRREWHVLESKSHTLRMYFLDLQTPEMFGKYLLRYEAIGCPDIETPPDAVVKRTGETAVIMCNKTQELWHIVCRDRTWIGHHRNCTGDTETSPHHREGPSNMSFPYGVLIAIGIGLILGILFGTTLLACMFHCRQRRKRRRNPRCSENVLLSDCSKDDHGQQQSKLMVRTPISSIYKTKEEVLQEDGLPCEPHYREYITEEDLGPPCTHTLLSPPCKHYASHGTLSTFRPGHHIYESSRGQNGQGQGQNHIILNAYDDQSSNATLMTSTSQQSQFHTLQRQKSSDRPSDSRTAMEAELMEQTTPLTVAPPQVKPSDKSDDRLGNPDVCTFYNSGVQPPGQWMRKPSAAMGGQVTSN